MNKTLKETMETLNDIQQESVKEANKKDTANVYKKYTEIYFKFLAENKFTVQDIKYLDGYFVFGFGNNSVVHYRIKECPNWQFAIWWSADDEVKKVSGDFFCEYDQLMDKFKPSRCAYCVNIDFLTDYDDCPDNYCFTFRQLPVLQFISKHPLRAFYKTYSGADFNTKYVSWLKILFTFIKFKIYEWISGICNKKWRKSETKFIINKVLPFCNYDDNHKAELIDLGDNISPRYEIRCEVPSNTDDEELGCFGIFDDDVITPERAKVKKKWDRLIARHEKISDIFCFFRDRVCDDYVLFYKNDVEEK